MGPRGPILPLVARTGKRKLTAGLLCIATASSAACGGGGGTPERAASPAALPAETPLAPAAGGAAAIGALRGGGVTAPEQHDIRGRVRSIPRDRWSVTLDHEAIPEVMEAMTNMEYGVADPAVLDGLAAGDEVEGRLEARSGRYLIVTLEKR